MEENKKFMSIVNEDGSVEKVEIILAFEFKDNKQEYVVYTKNEKDDNGNVTVYVSNVQYDLETIDKKIEKQINKYEKEANKLQENADLITASPYLTENVPVVFKEIHYELDTIYGTIDKLTTLSSTLHEGDKPLRLIEKMFKAIKKNCSKTLSAAEQVNSLEELSQVNKEANPEEIVSSRENVQEMQPPVVEETGFIC